MYVSGANDGRYHLGPSRVTIVTSGGGEGTFPYSSVRSEADAGPESSKGGSLRFNGLVFDAPVGGAGFPLDAAFARPAPDYATFPVSWISQDGRELKILGGDGEFSPGGGVVLVKRASGAEDLFEYSAVREDDGGTRTGPRGLMFTAVKGTRFPRTAAFAGRGEGRVGQAVMGGGGIGMYQVTWRSRRGMAHTKTLNPKP
jgi:hypothetical protein